MVSLASSLAEDDALLDRERIFLREDDLTLEPERIVPFGRRYLTVGSSIVSRRGRCAIRPGANLPPGGRSDTSARTYRPLRETILDLVNHRLSHRTMRNDVSFG